MFAHIFAIMGRVGKIHCSSFRRHTGALLFSIMASDWLVGDQFTAAEVFHQHANTDVPVE